MLMTVMLGDGGSSTPESGPSSMTVEVDADRLFATARELEATARKLSDWVADHSDRFAVRPPGVDVISTGIAEFFQETSNGPEGAFIQVQAAVKNLIDFANKLRESAHSYGMTDTTNATAFIPST